MGIKHTPRIKSGIYQGRSFLLTFFSCNLRMIFHPFSWIPSQSTIGRAARAQAPPMDEFQAMDRMEIKVQHHRSFGKSVLIFLENTIKIKGRAKAQRT